MASTQTAYTRAHPPPQRFPAVEAMMETPPESVSPSPSPAAGPEPTTTTTTATTNTNTTNQHLSNVPLSCKRCQARKIKCDRRYPCASCRKARLEAQCTPAVRAPRQPRRHPSKELKRRVERCEQYLRAVSTTLPAAQQDVPVPSAPVKGGAETPDSAASPAPWVPGQGLAAVTAGEGKLVEGENGAVVFMDNSLLASVHEELRSMRDMINKEEREVDETSCEPTPASTSSTSRNKSHLLLGGHHHHHDSPDSDAGGLWPDSHHVFRLWQTFLDRVHPLTKVIHAPSLQPYLVDASVAQAKVPVNVQCLCFAIFLMAAIAMTDEECRQTLDGPRKELISRFSSGTEIMLSRLDFLRANDLVLLQALVLYMISLQGRSTDHYTWSLNGVVVRIAQKMGLHRDGASLGLSPFKSEMRRRLWWQIVSLDGKFACASGLTQALSPRGWAVPEPANANDADLFPAATEPFADRAGPTEMVLCQAQYAIARFVLRAPELEPGPIAAGGLALTAFRAACEALFRDLETVRRARCHPAGGRAHRMAARFLDVLLEHFGRMFGGGAPGGSMCHPGVRRDSNANPNGATDTNNTQDDEHQQQQRVIGLAVAQVALSNQVTAACVDEGFGWFAVVHLPLDVMVFLARRLPALEASSGGDSKTKELAAEAWREIGAAYRVHAHLFDLDEELPRVLARAVLDAWRRRDETMLTSLNAGGVPGYVKRLADMLGESLALVAPGSGPGTGRGLGRQAHPGTGVEVAMDAAAGLPTLDDPSSAAGGSGPVVNLNDVVFPVAGAAGPTFDELFADGGGTTGLDEAAALEFTEQQMSYFMGFGMIPLTR